VVVTEAQIRAELEKAEAAARARYVEPWFHEFGDAELGAALRLVLSDQELAGCGHVLRFDDLIERVQCLARSRRS